MSMFPISTVSCRYAAGMPAVLLVSVPSSATTTSRAQQTLIYQHNLEAVCLLQDGRFEAATHALYSALQLTQSMLMQPERGDHTRPGASFMEGVESDGGVKSTSGFVAAVPANKSGDIWSHVRLAYNDISHREAAFLPTNRFALYHDVFYTTKTAHDDDIGTFAVLLYNLALTFHVHGIRTGSASVLVKSLRLYDMAFDAVRDRTQRTASETLQPNDLVLILAIINNMAQLHDHFDHAKPVETCAQLLDSFLAVAATAAAQCACTDMEFFVIALVTYKTCCVPSGAAMA